MNDSKEGNSVDDRNPPEEFQHFITAHVNTDVRGREFLKFSTYLSFLKLTFRVYIPDEGTEKTDVIATFSLKRRQKPTGPAIL